VQRGEGRLGEIVLIRESEGSMGSEARGKGCGIDAASPSSAMKKTINKGFFIWNFCLPFYYFVL